MTKNTARRFTKPAAALAALGLSFTLAACGTTATANEAASAGSTTSTTSSTAAASTGDQAQTLWADNVESHAEADDTAYSADEAVSIDLADSGSTVTGSSTEGVSVDGSAVTITAPGTYVFSGTLSDGQVVVNSTAEGTVRLVLAGADITNTGGSAIVVTEADEAVLVLADGTSNTVTDGTGYDTSAEDAPNAAIFSMADLTIGGSGALTVTGNTNDGITSKDGLVITGGTIDVTATDDGIRGKDYVIVDGGTIDVTAGGDGITSDNETDDTVGYVAVDAGTVTIDAGDDGIHAEGDLAVNDGTVTVSQSVEGLEGYSVTLAGGATSVTASDDGINVSDGSSETTTTGGGPGGGGGGEMSDTGQYLLISGGQNVVTAEGDGLDSNGPTIISGGVTVVNGPTNSGNGALDANGGTTVTGGTLLAAGSSGMTEAPADGSIGWASVTLDSPLAAGETVGLVASDGTVVATYTAVKDVSSVVLAAEGITAGETYQVVSGGQLAAEATGTFSLGGTAGTQELTSVVAGEHTGGGMGGMGGGPR